MREFLELFHLTDFPLATFFFTSFHNVDQYHLTSAILGVSSQLVCPETCNISQLISDNVERIYMESQSK